MSHRHANNEYDHEPIRGLPVVPSSTTWAVTS